MHDDYGNLHGNAPKDEDGNLEIIHQPDAAAYLQKRRMIFFVEGLYLIRHVQEVLKLPYQADATDDILPLASDKWDMTDPMQAKVQ